MPYALDRTIGLMLSPTTSRILRKARVGWAPRRPGRGWICRKSREEVTKMEKFDRITMDVARMNGEPCIRDLRLTVRRVLEALAIYPERAELKREYPELEDEDIRQALAFAAALVDDKVLPLPGTR